VTLVATGDLGAAATVLRALSGVREVTTADGRVDVLVEEARRLLPRILEAVSNDGVTVRSVEVVEPDLESVFLHLTGKALRD
jgi:ABC-2 type transport system ATP-binding protein